VGKERGGKWEKLFSSVEHAKKGWALIVLFSGRQNTKLVIGHT